MSKPFIAVLLALAAGGALAQDVTEVAAERQRIAAERSRVEAHFLAEQKACYARFAVSDCIETAKTRRIEQLADLRRQEVSLNDMQRRERSAERVKQLEQKEAEQQRRRDDDAARAAAQHREREARAAEKAAKAGQDGRQGRQKSAAASEPRASHPAPDVEANRRRTDERLREAREHKAKVQDQAAQPHKDIKPLPVPP